MGQLLYNKKSGLKYEILETISAGIVLSGPEVKSLRKQQGSLDGAYITIRGTIVEIINMFISPYQPNNVSTGLDPLRKRRLLLSAVDILRLSQQTNQKGLTLVPISVYTRGRFVKVDVALVRGKKRHDQRETLKKKQANRDIERSLKNY